MTVLNSESYCTCQVSFIEYSELDVKQDFFYSTWPNFIGAINFMWNSFCIVKQIGHFSIDTSSGSASLFGYPIQIHPFNDWFEQWLIQHLPALHGTAWLRVLPLWEAWSWQIAGPWSAVWSLPAGSFVCHESLGAAYRVHPASHMLQLLSGCSRP